MLFRSPFSLCVFLLMCVWEYSILCVCGWVGVWCARACVCLRVCESPEVLSLRCVCEVRPLFDEEELTLRSVLFHFSGRRREGVREKDWNEGANSEKGASLSVLNYSSQQKGAESIGGRAVTGPQESNLHPPTSSFGLPPYLTPPPPRLPPSPRLVLPLPHLSRSLGLSFSLSFALAPPSFSSSLSPSLCEGATGSCLPAFYPLTRQQSLTQMPSTEAKPRRCGG